ncbi:NAD(P)-dependent dehydrogenase (short-subunit alcohol dehydrogenase family) [Chitinophaga dinghuensis]|uniref:NAD(P)-dependent dehydrogenase (Short-subunit alcohol dehydrogenase family) n=1 Tax=Chitinophaga dinghuensis TaxID=1539050 RepID=A0A327WBS1_9BACT|nr:SDR family oxidoreductase [Chitinophaga dinghuensis]RAJ87965.1 NAD(P)-dependent dehydrogenase (short-subunit alcohol dehydrogenase family) [Chitinophaga dinghuensis]
MSGNFEGKKVIVAGGSTGVGLAAARQLQDAKAQVTITGRSKEKLQQAAAALPGINTAAVDSGDRAALDQFFQEHGPFDHLVVTLSGGKGAGQFSTLPLQDLQEGFEGKFWPQLNTIQAALPHINKAGSITIVTAVSSILGLPGTSGLAAINGSLELMIPAIAKEIQPVRINAVSPGVIDTPWWDFLPTADKKAAFDSYAAQTPAGRVGKPEEVADGILFLARNNFVTGTVVRVDGGLSL